MKTDIYPLAQSIHLIAVNLACQLNGSVKISVTLFRLQQKIFPDSLSIL